MSKNFKLNINEYLKQCDSKDVISFNNERWLDVNKLKSIVCLSFYHAGINAVINRIANQYNFKTNNIEGWFRQGEECEILRAGSSGWQKGKIKINVTLEFIPDAPEEKSPLDEVRQELKQNNS